MHARLPSRTGVLPSWQDLRARSSRSVRPRSRDSCARAIVPAAASWFALALALELSAGCSMSRFAADTTAGFLADAAPAARAYFDYETAGAAAANGIVQLE